MDLAEFSSHLQALRTLAETLPSTLPKTYPLAKWRIGYGIYAAQVFSGFPALGWVSGFMPQLSATNASTVDISLCRVSELCLRPRELGGVRRRTRGNSKRG